MKAGAHVLGVLQRVARVELVDVGELGGLQEVQQRPELTHAVLQRRARDEQLVLEVPLAQLLRTWTPQSAQHTGFDTTAGATNQVHTHLLLILTCFSTFAAMK